MHVFQVLGDFGDGGDGAVARGLATGLAECGVRSTCVAVRSNNIERSNGSCFDTVGLSATGRWPSTIRALCGMRLCVRRRLPDVIHAHGANSLLLVKLALVGMRQPPPVVFTWHDSGSVLQSGGVTEAIQRFSISRCSRVFGSSQGVVDRLQIALPRRSDLEVFRNGVPVTARSAGLLSATPQIIWMGRFVPPKAPGLLIRAVGQLHARALPCRVVMCGDALPHLKWFFEEVVAQARLEGIEDVVEFPGWVSDSDRLNRESALGVQTSRTEGLSMALLEQMMAGLCIVATDVGDTARAIVHEETGLLVPPDDLDALVAAIERVLVDRSLRARLGNAARERALGEFSLEAMAQRALAFYAEAIGG